MKIKVEPDIGDRKMRVDIGPGLNVSEILKDFPKKFLIVGDKNTLAAANLQLDKDIHCYENCTEANIKQVDALEILLKNYDGVLAVGSGSICDICRLASFNAKKEFAVFATAPSMDGYASGSAPIIFGNFKKSVPAHAPSVIIGDTDILSAAPEPLKAAGFGDIIAKYVALVDWQIADLISDNPEEAYDLEAAALVKAALEKSIANPSSSQAMMEALVQSGIAMAMVKHTRPASGAEHLLAHFWEIKKIEKGEPVAFHGAKAGVGTLMITQLYHNIAAGKYGEPNFQEDAPNWEAIYKVYGEAFKNDLESVNKPSILETTSFETLKRKWPEIVRLIQKELPSYEKFLNLMQQAKCITKIEGIDIDRQLALDAIKFHPYMRHRINLTRLIPMLGFRPNYEEIVDEHC